MNVIEQEFDSVAAEYESNRLAPWYKAHAEEILSACPPRIDGDVLDVGCGTGYLLRRLLARNPRSHGIGLDISGEMVAWGARLAAAEAVTNVHFVKADWETVDLGGLAGRRFPLVVCANAFHYFSDPQAAAAKLFKVLTPGGALFVLERNKLNSPLTQAWAWLHRHVIKDNVEFYGLDELQALFRESGFVEVKVLRAIRRLAWKNKLYTDVVLLKCTKG